MFNKKILCLGSNTRNTDDIVSNLAKINNAINHGLITNIADIVINYGYYHTTITDLSSGEIVELANKFDQIILLDQPREHWNHWKSLLSTYKVMLELKKLGHDTIFSDNENVKVFNEFGEFIKTNKSFCIYPWINQTDANGTGYLNICARSDVSIIKWTDIKDWRSNPEFTEIRQKMLAGERLPEHCRVCYEYEDRGIESYRIHDTKDWISKLDIRSIEDLDKITSPKYYEIRLSNKCNIMCRSCDPSYSHLIAREYKIYNITPTMNRPENFEYSKLEQIDISTLDPSVRVYLTGGEPTIMAEVLQFMKNCIAAGKIDFDFTLGTNAVKISKKFLELADNFTNLGFSVSIDGYGKINDYWRWGSNFETLIENTKLLQSHGHHISINCVPGIYNVTNLHLLYEFLDKEFPHATVYSQLNYDPLQSVWNHPNAELVVESMIRCKQTKVYYADGKSNKSTIDSLYDYYINKPEPNLENLKKFFEHNDKLDAARGSRLADYIPELDECRKYIGVVP